MGDGVEDMRWGSWRAGVLLVILCLAVYLPGVLCIPVVDRDEARFAQASRQMLESGDYVVPRIQGRPRLNKPPVIYWLEALAVRVLTGGESSRDAIWMYRVPSLLAAIATVLFTWRLGLSMFSARAGALGAAMLAVCPVMYWESHQARADMVLVAFTTLAAWMLWECWRRSNAPTPSRTSLVMCVLLWLAVAGGIMTKGPMTPLVIGAGAVAISVVSGRWRWLWQLRPVLGLVIVAAAVGPWLYLVTRQIGWETYISTIRDEVLGRSMEPKEGHGGFPGYHTILLPFLLLPGSVLVGLGVWAAVKDVRVAWRGRRTGVTGGAWWLLTLAAPTWLILELVGTKLPHYAMPVYPLLAILIARVADTQSLAGLLEWRVVRGAFAAWLIAVPLFLLGMSVLLGVGFRSVPIGLGCICGAAVLAAIFGFAANRAFRAQSVPRLLVAGVLAFVPVAAGGSVTLAEGRHLWVTEELMFLIHYLDPKSDRPLAAVGYQEDSLVFATRGRVERIEAEDLDGWFAKHPGGLAIIPAAIDETDSRWPVLGGVEGFNYTKGRWVSLAVVEARK